MKLKQNEERNKQKQKRQKKNLASLTLLTNTKVLPYINDGPNVAETSFRDKKSVSPDLDTKLVGNERGPIMFETNSKEEMIGYAMRQRLSTLLNVSCSRSATVLQIVLEDDARPKPTQYSRPALALTTFYRFHIGMILRSGFI